MMGTENGRRLSYAVRRGRKKKRSIVVVFFFFFVFVVFQFSLARQKKLPYLLEVRVEQQLGLVGRLLGRAVADEPDGLFEASLERLSHSFFFFGR